MAANALRYELISPMWVLAFVFGASIVVLGAALVSQYVGGLEPCVLCLYQRVPYVLTISISALALVSILAGKPRPSLLLAALGACGLVFLGGAGLAGFHVGVEQGWWEGTQGCTGPDLNSMSVDELREHLLRAPIVRCDEVAWSLFGISMAGYNFLISIVLAAGCAVFARPLPRQSAPA